jgi:hypothetical protein
MTVRWLLRLYPAAWRALYEEEFRAVLEQRPLSIASVLDIAAGAFDAHLHLRERTGRGTSPLESLQSTTLTVLCAYSVCLVGVWHLGALMDDGPYAFNMAAGHPGPILELDFANPLSVAADALAFGVLVAALALFVGGSPLAVAVWRRAPHRRRLFLGPPLAAAAMLVPPIVALIAHVLSGGAVSTTALFTPGTPLGIAYTVWIVATAGAGTAAIVRGLGVDTLEAIDARRVRFAFVPSLTATAALLLMTAATIAWGISAHVRSPQLFDALTLKASYATVLPWAIIATLMGVASAVAVLAIVRTAPARAAIDRALAL